MLGLAVRCSVAIALATAALIACGTDDTTDSGSASSSGNSSSGSTFTSEQVPGIATYYDATGDGSCSFGTSADLDVAAFDFPDFAKSAACGSCIAVSGPKGVVTVRIVDSCPSCENHHLDLSESAFAKIADKKDGRVPVTYQTVACKTTGSMAYQFKEGSQEFWTAIQIRKHRLPITKVEARKNGAWEELKRTDYNYFLDDEGIKDAPIALRITAADGQVVLDSMPGAKGKGGREFQGAVQFK